MEGRVISAQASPPPADHPATLEQVARLAGVSIATASKALNGRPHVAAHTREQVLQAASQLSYSPNALAQSLVAGRTGTVGLLTSDLVGRFSIPVLMGAEDAFGSDRVSVLLCDARGDAIRERHHLQTLLSHRIDGLIVVGARPDPRATIGRNLPVPVVYAYGPSSHPDDLSLVIDNVGAGRMAVDHLVDCGRRRIAHITGDPTYVASQDRAEGALGSLSDHDLPLVGDRVFYGSWSEQWGRSATMMLLNQEPDVDAIFAGSDQIARGVLDVLEKRGRKVPEDVSVIGFDNWTIIAEGSSPTLTSIDMNLERLGREAARRLFEGIGGGLKSGVETFPCRLVPRDSTAPVG